LTVHHAYLAGFRNRLSVMLEWAYAYFTFRPSARLITEDERLDVPTAAPPAATSTSRTPTP